VKTRDALLYAFLLLAGASRFLAYGLSAPRVEAMLARAFVSPRPNPFVNLPVENLDRRLRPGEACDADGCIRTNYLEQIRDLRGPHRYRVQFYLAVLDPLREPNATIVGNTLCRADEFLNRRPFRAPRTVAFGELHHDCR
jgi:hypothetical protein